MNKRQRIAILVGMAALVVYAAFLVPHHGFERDRPGDVDRLENTRRGHLFRAEVGSAASGYKGDYSSFHTEFAIRRMFVEVGFIAALTAGIMLVLGDKFTLRDKKTTEITP